MTKRHQYSSSNNSINGIGNTRTCDHHCQQLRWAKIFSLRRREFGLRTNNDEALQIYNTSAQNDPMSNARDETTVLMYHCKCPVIAHDDVWLDHTRLKWGSKRRDWYWSKKWNRRMDVESVKTQ
jgi:hypothetical protein